MIFNTKNNSQILWESTAFGGAGLLFSLTGSAGYGLKILSAGVGCALIPIAYKVSEYAAKQLRKKHWLSQGNEAKIRCAITIILSGASMWLLEGMRLQPFAIFGVQAAATGVLFFLKIGGLNLNQLPTLAIPTVTFQTNSPSSLREK